MAINLDRLAAYQERKVTEDLTLQYSSQIRSPNSSITRMAAVVEVTFRNTKPEEGLDPVSFLPH